MPRRDRRVTLPPTTAPRCESTTPSCGERSNATAGTCSPSATTASPPRSRVRPTRRLPPSNVQEQLRDDAVVDFPVRMGLHTGDAIPRDQSYVGSEVSRAARLLSLAHGGQVLVSDATEVLLRDRVTLRSLGEHRLRGRHGRMSVYQVVADGLPLDFPVLRSTDDFPGNLPQQLTSLVGREPVVADVAELLRSTSLVTLTGVGGVGKSRLALEVGAEVAAEFPDGVWLIELASLGDPTSIPAALATVLGITPQGDTPLLDTVAETLRGRQALLLVDNCEHLLTAVAAVARRDPGVLTHRHDPRHLTRTARARRRSRVHRRPARGRRWRVVGCRHPVRRPGTRGAARLRPAGVGHRHRSDRDLRGARRPAARHRAGRRRAWRR